MRGVIYVRGEIGVRGVIYVIFDLGVLGKIYCFFYSVEFVYFKSLSNFVLSNGCNFFILLSFVVLN